MHKCMEISTFIQVQIIMEEAGEKRGRKNDATEQFPREKRGSYLAKQSKINSRRLETDTENPASRPTRQSKRKSMADEIKEAKLGSNGFCEFLKRFLKIIMSTVIFTIMLCLMLAIPVSSVIVGALYLDECPAQKMIPLFLVVDGSVGSALLLYSLIWRCIRTREERERERNFGDFLSGLGHTFLFVWLVVGSVYVYGTSDWDADTHSDNWCDPTVYYFAFWLITVKYIFLGLAFCLCCWGLLLAGRASENEQ